MFNLSRSLERFFFRLLPEALRARLKRASESNKAIVYGIGWVTAFLLLGKLIAVGKEILVAYRYGTGPAIDGYLFVFNIIQWPTSLFFSVVSSALIPYFSRLRTQVPGEADQLYKAVVLISFVFGISASLLGGFGLWWLVTSDLTGPSGEGRLAALDAIPWLAPTLLLGFLMAIHSTWLMSMRRHANTFLEAMPALGIMLCLMLWPSGYMNDTNVLPLAVGTLAGFLLQVILLVHLAGFGVGKVSLTNFVAHWRALRGALSVMFLTQFVMSCSGLIDQFFAVRMGEGVLARLSYAQRVMALFLGLSGTVIGRAMLPVFSSVTDAQERFVLAKRWAWRSAVGGGVAMLLIAALAQLFVMLLFERGQFSENDTQAVSLILAILALQLPFYLASMVLVQWIATEGKHKWLFVASLIGFLVKLFAALVFYDFGASGLAGSTAVMYTVIALILLFTFNVIAPK